MFFFLTNINLTLGQENKNNSISFHQGDNLYKIDKDSDSIELERKPFSIRYFSKLYDDVKIKKFYSAQIDVLDNPNDTLVIKIGQTIKDIPYFRPGTGMAPFINGM